MNAVSIISVCFNEEPIKIKETMNSIIAQDYKNMEIIIIDGRSKPETLNAFEEYRKQINYMVSEPDRGIFDAMNKGVSKATGDWVIFMNMGDKFYNNHSLSGLMAGAKSGVDILYGHAVKNNLINLSPQKISKYKLYSRGICHQALIVKRSLFSFVGNFDLAYKLCADPEWLFRAFKKGANFKYMDVVVAYYEGNGLSSNYELRKPFWESAVHKHCSRIEIVAYWLRLILERAIRRVIKLDFRLPVSIKTYYSSFCRTSRKR